MSLYLSFAMIVMASVALVKGVTIFISSSSHLAHKLKISGYTISFFLVAIGTSLPETVVAITSALEKNPILSYGNAMGSNIALLTFVVAIPAIFGAGLSTRTILNSKDIYYTALFSLFPVMLSVDGILSRTDGIILLTSYIVYSRAVIKRATGVEGLMDTFEHSKPFKQLGLFIFSLLILLVSSHLIVTSAVNISEVLGISLGLVGLTITALGTSLPEITYSIAEIKNNQKEEILGNIVGSVVANSTMVLGLTATIYPINIAASNIGIPTVFFLVLTLLVFLRLAKSKQKLDTVEGLILFSLYILFVSSEFIVANHGGL